LHLDLLLFFFLVACDSLLPKDPLAHLLVAAFDDFDVGVGLSCEQLKCIFVFHSLKVLRVKVTVRLRMEVVSLSTLSICHGLGLGLVLTAANLLGSIRFGKRIKHCFIIIDFIVV